MDEELYFSLLKIEINIVKSMGIKAVKSSKNEIQELHNALFTHEYETLDEIRDSLSVCKVFPESMSMLDRVKYCLEYMDCFNNDFEGSKERMGWYIEEEVAENTLTTSSKFPTASAYLDELSSIYYSNPDKAEHLTILYCMVPSPYKNRLLSLLDNKEGYQYPAVIASEYFVNYTGEQNTRNEEKTDNDKIISLDEIDSLCMEKYHEYPNRIIMIVLARFDLDEVKTIIRKHYKYWHEVTGERIDFFWLGYGVRQTPSVYYGEPAEDFLRGIRFDNHTFVKDTTRLGRLAGFDFGDEIGLLLLDCNRGSVRYDKSLYLNIEALVHQEVDTKLKKFFNFLIRVCSEKECIEDVKTELKAQHAIYSLGDITISDVISATGSGAGLIGSFIFA